MSQVTRFTKEEKDRIAKEAIEAGNQRATADKYNIPYHNIYSWVKAYRGRDEQEAKKSSRSLQKELDDALLENKILKELLKKTTQTLIKD